MASYGARHDRELRGQGYTILSAAVGPALLAPAQATAARLAASWPEGGWERSRNESWREIRDCQHPDFVAIVEAVLDPLAGEILESVHRPERIQLASTMPGFSTTGVVGRHFHIDGGTRPSLAAFNVLLGVALTDVQSDTAGGFHVLAGSHLAFAGLFAAQPPAADTDWGEVKIAGQKKLIEGARMVVPRLKAGDVIVAHSFLAHGTSANTSDTRRDMLFQRRAALPLTGPDGLKEAREAFMRDPWLHFRSFR
jgi:Phytanoyl-CoA dioxygenase (PhyH)